MQSPLQQSWRLSQSAKRTARQVKKTKLLLLLERGNSCERSGERTGICCDCTEPGKGGHQGPKSHVMGGLRIQDAALERLASLVMMLIALRSAGYVEEATRRVSARHQVVQKAQALKARQKQRPRP